MKTLLLILLGTGLSLAGIHYTDYQIQAQIPTDRDTTSVYEPYIYPPTLKSYLDMERKMAVGWGVDDLIPASDAVDEWEFDILRPVGVAVNIIGTPFKMAEFIPAYGYYTKTSENSWIEGVVVAVELPLEWSGSSSGMTYQASVNPLPAIGDTVKFPADGTWLYNGIRFGRPSIILREK